MVISFSQALQCYQDKKLGMNLICGTEIGPTNTKPFCPRWLGRSISRGFIHSLTWVSLYYNSCWRKGFAYVTGQQGMPLKLIANGSNGHELYGVELSV